MTLCTGCHSLVHNGLLIVRGRIPDQLRFTDAQGRDLRDLGDTIQDALAVVRRDARATTESPVDFASLPGRVDAEWWGRHAHLLAWKDGRSTLEFTPGVPCDPPAPVNDCGRAPVAVDARAARPQRFGDVIGQRRAVANIRRAVNRARHEGAPLRHILLHGPAGLGKTTLARIVAREMGTTCRQVSGPVVKEVGALLGLLTSLGEGDVLFIDEIHGLPRPVAEFLYEAMEDGVVSLPVSCGIHRRTLQVRLRPFTVVGATTDPDLLEPSFRGRFALREQLEFYEAGDVAEILRRAAARAGRTLEPAAARGLASVSRDTPREGLALLESVLDEAVPAGRQRIDANLIADVLASLEIDDRGLRPLDRRYLGVLEDEGRPVGRTTLARRLGVTGEALLELHEPYLIRRGFVRVTPLGRELARL
jgi:Holliday junction DNA helicase RuvB